ncbi:MAG: hypothetical protein R8K46_01360 [Mariprofundaceae bacterium]
MHKTPFLAAIDARPGERFNHDGVVIEGRRTVIWWKTYPTWFQAYYLYGNLLAAGARPPLLNDEVVKSPAMGALT